jgi:hypothetical protein
MEQDSLRDFWDDTASNPASPNVLSTYDANLFPSIPGLLCPSDTSNDQESLAPNSYAINAGFYYVFTNGPTGFSALSTEEQELRATSKQNSASYNAAPAFNTGVLKNGLGNNTAGLKYSGFRDGLSNTILWSENLQANSWNSVSTGSDNSVRYHLGFGWLYRLDNPDAIVPSANNGGATATRADQVEVVNRINGDKMNVGLKGQIAGGRPSSMHTGIVNVALADGSVRTLSETIDYHVYTAFLTPMTGQSDAPFNKYILKDADAN